MQQRSVIGTEHIHDAHAVVGQHESISGELRVFAMQIRANITRAQIQQSLF
jgi:hypothetical protein